MKIFSKLKRSSQHERIIAHRNTSFNSNTPNSKNNISQYSINTSKTEKFLSMNSDTIASDTSRKKISITPKPSHSEEYQDKKPVSLIILEKYFSDVYQMISNKGIIDLSLSSKAENMHRVLKDCLTAIQNLSLEIYVLMASTLKEIQHIHSSSDQKNQISLSNKLLQICSIIEDKKYRSETEKNIINPEEKSQEAPQTVLELANELNTRIFRVTPRVLNIWKKIIYPQKEAGIICSCFLLLYYQIDSTIKVTPFVKIRFDKAVNLMKDFTVNPGYAVTIIRKTQEYIDKELISIDTMKRIKELLDKISVDKVKNVDKTLTGFVIYEMIYYAVKYYEVLAKEKYNIEVFRKENFNNKIKEIKIPEKSIGISQSDNFGIVLQTDRVKGRSHSSGSDSDIKLKTATPTAVLKITTKSPLSKKIDYCQTERSTKPQSFSPQKKSSQFKLSMILKSKSTKKFKPSDAFKIKPQKTFSPLKPKSRLSTATNPIKKSSKSIDIKLTTEKKLLFSPGTKRDSSNESINSARKSLICEPCWQSEKYNNRDVLEEMQYKQFIEEKFRQFLVDKLNQSTGNNSEIIETKFKNEEKAIKNREIWMKEFQDQVGIIRFNAILKLGDEKRFTAELIRAQRQIELLEKFE